MLRTHHMIFIFLPALLIVSIIFGIRVFQYNAIFQSQEDNTDEVSLELIPILKDDPIIGSSAAPQTLIAFEDFSCDGCKSQNILLKELEQRHPGKIKTIWKGLPVATFPYSSEPAHEYAFCANKQNKFSSFKEFAFANSTNLSKNTLDTIVEEVELDKDDLADCLASEQPLLYIDTVRQLARILHIQHVPTFFLDNTQIPAPASIEEWEAVLGL